MGICAKELVEFVIRPTLEQLGVWSPAAEQLLLGTAARESGLGYHLGNLDTGCGIYRITAATHQDVWDQFLAFRPDMASAVRGLASQKEFLSHPHAELSTNLAYATAVAWSIYCWRDMQLGASTDPLDLGRVWQTCFNPESGLGADAFADSYQRYVGVEPLPHPEAAPLHPAAAISGHFTA